MADEKMGGKRNRKKPNHGKKRGRRTNPGQIAAVSVCAVVLCAVAVCVVIWGAGRLMGSQDAGKTADIAAKDIQEGKSQEETVPRILTEEPGQLLSAVVRKEEQETAPQTVSAQGKEQEGEEQQMPQETEQTETTVSILGDSISTFRDYIPAGYYDFFPENGLVSDVNDTWWKRVLDDTGWTLYVNGSSSGATCTGDSTGTADPQCGCNEFRTGALYGPGKAVPDVIIVYMGTNDLLQSIPMGDNDGTRQVAEGQILAFSDAYTLMIDKLLAKYPASKIYCCTITQIGDYGTATPYVEFVNGEGLTAADYSARIMQIAANKGLPVIDLYSCGIAVDNLHNTSADGVHPTPDGMKYIAEAVRKALD